MSREKQYTGINKDISLTCNLKLFTTVSEIHKCSNYFLDSSTILTFDLPEESI